MATSHLLHGRAAGVVAERSRYSAGFTLIELVTVIAVIGILAAIAAPSFTSLIAAQRAKSAAADLHAALTKARSEAIKRNANVTLAPNTSGAWNAGWKIADPADPTRRLDERAALAGVNIVGPADVTFQSSGRVRGNAAPSFDISVAGSDTHWCGTVDLSGRPSLKKATSC